jgi:SAM-dependent methyltransferase
MEYVPNIFRVSKAIRQMAREAMQNLSTSDSASKIAKHSVVRPINYMRCAEFDAILRGLNITPGMRILDVSSPQWFTIYLAKSFPATQFDYCNIIDIELEPYKTLCYQLGITNLQYHKEDVRNLSFDSDSFDKVVSISVIEHVFPEQGGDYSALQEIKRVLKPEGELLLTIPYKESRNIIYFDGVVYERGAKDRNFYAREYDNEMFDKLVNDSGYTVRDAWFICEKKGLFSIDYWVWGPGKRFPLARSATLKIRRVVESLFGYSIDELLARRYLRISSQDCNRLVNIAAVLTTDR